MATLLPNVRQQFLDANGAPLVGGKLYSFAAGTSTPQDTFTDEGEGTPNTNPVILDANGMASIWCGELSYKFRLDDATDVTQWTVDNVSAIEIGAVTTTKLGDLSVTTAKLANKNVTTGKIADQAVDTGQIKDAAVTTNKIADLAVGTAEIADLAVGTTELADNAVTQAKRAALGQQISSSCGSFSDNTGVETDATDLTVTITTTGRPVWLGLVDDASGGASFLVLQGIADTSFVDGDFYLYNGTTKIANPHLRSLPQSLTGTGVINVTVTVSGSSGTGTGTLVASGLKPSLQIPVGALWTIDVPAAGTYIYKVTVKSASGGGLIGISNAKLVAFEL